MIKDYYGILGVDPGARPEEIVEAFFRLTRKYHPLINPTPKARRRMREIAEAWEVLGDARSRARYDRQRRAEMSFLHAAFEAFGSHINLLPRILRMGAGLMGGVWKTLLPVTIALAILAVVYTPVLLGARSYAAAQKIGSAGVVTAVSAKNIAMAPTRTPARPVLSRVVISHETETAVAKRATVAESPARLSTPTLQPTRQAPLILEATAAPLKPTVTPSRTPTKVQPTVAPTKAQPTVKPTNSPTPRPQATATRQSASYSPPRLIGPAPNTSYSCPQDLVLAWSAAGVSLKPDEWFLIETRQTDHAEWFTMTDWTRDLSVTLHPSSAKGGCEAGWWRGPGVYEWRVRIVRGDRSSHAIRQYLSNPSEAFVIINKR